MTKTEYEEAYRKARKQFPTLTRTAMGKLRKIYIKAGAMASEAVRAAELSGGSFSTYSQSLIEEALRQGSVLINNELTELIPETVKSGIDIDTEINYKYITDAFEDSGIVTKAGIKGMLFGVDDILIRSIVNRMYTDGYTLSYRVWKVGSAYQDQITRVMTAGLANGRSTVQVARDIQVYIADGKTALVNRYGELKRGTKAFVNRIGNRVDYRALRLVRSELYAGLQDAAKEHGRVNPGCVDLYDWVLEAARQHWDCSCPENASNGPYTYENVPAYSHANCRCSIRPVLRDTRTFYNDIKSWVNGENVEYLDNWYRQIYKAS